MRSRPLAMMGLTILFLAVPTTLGMGIDFATLWPVDRIVANLEERCERDPADVPSLYTLGRTHAFAFVLERGALFAFGNDEGTYLRDFWKQERSVKRGEIPAEGRAGPTELLAHLGSAVKHLSRVVRLAPETAEHHLTLAWILEMGAHLADRFDTAELLELPNAQLTDAEREFLSSRISALRSDEGPSAEAALSDLMAPAWLERAAVPLSRARVASKAAAHARISRLLERVWMERSIANYRQAYEIAVAMELQDTPEGRFVVHPDFAPLVSDEAGPAFLRLARARGLLEAEQAFAASVESTLAEMRTLPVQAMVTPLLLSLADCKTLDELVLPASTVPFDLDGDAVDELWPWIAPGTGWLVWDPERRGEITSGRQLFGSASAWLFFADGYRVLDALDDDRDGELRGAELNGIAVWFDRDTDGVSDRGEVVPVEELGIVALATESTLTVGPSPANLCGLELADGRVLPTYDWVLESRNEP